MATNVIKSLPLLFDRKRFLYLLKKEGYEDLNNRLIQFSLIALIIPFVTIFFPSQSLIFDPNPWFFIIILVGFGYSTQSFHAPLYTAQRSLYLLLPASHLEKLLSKLLLSTVGFVLISAGASCIGWGLAKIINLIFLHRTIFLQYSWPASAWNDTRYYLVFQALFLFAGIFFKKNPIFKAIISLMLLFMGLSFLAMFISFIFFHASIALSNLSALISFVTNIINNQSENIAAILRFAFWFLLAPFFWVLSYIRLREMES
jgi:hypothetical protein